MDVDGHGEWQDSSVSRNRLVDDDMLILPCIRAVLRIKAELERCDPQKVSCQWLHAGVKEYRR
jgi:hypothetical protein